MSADVLLLALMAAAIYLLILAPARNRAKRAADIKANLIPGAEVMTTSGMFGRVERVEDDEFHLAIAPGVVVRFTKGAIGKIIVPKDGAPAPGGAPNTNRDEGTTHGGGDDLPPAKTL